MKKNRRHFVRGIISILSPFLFLQACKRTARREDLRSYPRGGESGSSEAPAAPPETEGFRPFEGSSDTEALLEPPPNVDAEGECPASGLVAIDKIRIAPEDLELASRTYGKSGSVLFAFRLPKYVHGNLRGFYLVRENGEPLAYKPVFPGIEVKADQLGIQYLDHLPLKEGDFFAIVFQWGADVYKSPRLGPVKFERRFRDLPIVGFGEFAPVGGLVAPSLVPKFRREDIEVWEGDYWNFSSGGAFHPSNDLREFILTDLMGSVLAEEGDKFTEFEKYPMIIAYRNMGTLYARTFLRFS
ncbi:MAG: hypothetical protein HYW48_04520 [Deltaproteobacteria bacterium]|nr:hypothetical protein [Deltaproteobacteria bacterium]